ncbi:MAG: TIGR03960 family B12-binding radical SAM protein [Chloroflexi bacterium]|nr:TIGR03960 family B12-binding radical SAM protein [Chloroflexota bacterium]
MTNLNDILPKVTRPGRYTGGEWNSIAKDWDSTPIKIALSYPDTYEIGMSNIALPILYDFFNRQPDTLAERVFAPWVDMEAVMRERDMPLFSLESKRPLKDFNIIGFSLGYELTYTNVLNMLDLAHIPVLVAERGENYPFIIAGGSTVLNPEPMADFIDLFVIGDGEEVALELLEVYRQWKKAGGSGKSDFLRQAAPIPGIYVPGLYQVEYQADGLLTSFTPTVPEAKSRIQRRIVDKLPPPITNQVVPYIEVVHDRGAIEIQRGCSRGCRFCQAGIIYRPVRERPREEVLKAAGEIIGRCGYDKISLVSLSTGDYGGIDELVTGLVAEYPNLALSLPSLRISQFSVRLMGTLPERSRTGLTFAPEAGSERLRRVINKNTPEEELLETAAIAFERGWTGLKLYFMLGLPTETAEDVAEIVRLVEKIRSLGKQVSGKVPSLRVSAATFIPKPHTPFQWVGQEDEKQLNAKHEILRQGLRRLGAKLSWQDPKASLLEAVISRGDRRLGAAIHRAWKMGAKFDAWNEHFNYENWRRAFDESGLDPAFYAHRQRTFDELLPWAHIDLGISTAFLKKEYRFAMEGKETPDCRYNDCYSCGLQRRHPGCRQKLKARS